MKKQMSEAHLLPAGAVLAAKKQNDVCLFDGGGGGGECF